MSQTSNELALTTQRTQILASDVDISLSEELVGRETIGINKVLGLISKVFSYIVSDKKQYLRIGEKSYYSLLVGFQHSALPVAVLAHVSSTTTSLGRQFNGSNFRSLEQHAVVIAHAPSIEPVVFELLFKTYAERVALRGSYTSEHQQYAAISAGTVIPVTPVLSVASMGFIPQLVPVPSIELPTE